MFNIFDRSIENFSVLKQQRCGAVVGNDLSFGGSRRGQLATTREGDVMMETRERERQKTGGLLVRHDKAESQGPLRRYPTQYSATSPCLSSFYR
ncbi:hypothetical protein EVAR_29525_1 [Eumeta japonica]|uniref:Uncharacterized protein n=1 Tax=Eumeta variegata TaxID=151549 RepID=A0A4C1WHA6_EUMVA|nr:hypothetical protein EVAR_29525_1 [Eumeta japonica]